jgi:hypothetical protein
VLYPGACVPSHVKIYSSVSTLWVWKNARFFITKNDKRFCENESAWLTNHHANSECGGAVFLFFLGRVMNSLALEKHTWAQLEGHVPRWRSIIYCLVLSWALSKYIVGEKLCRLVDYPVSGSLARGVGELTRWAMECSSEDWSSVGGGCDTDTSSSIWFSPPAQGTHWRLLRSQLLPDGTFHYEYNWVNSVPSPPRLLAFSQAPHPTHCSSTTSLFNLLSQVLIWAAE